MRNYFYAQSIGWLLLSLLAGIEGHAQNDTLVAKSLNEVVISASRQEERILNIPRTVTVIDRGKIENSVYNSVGDLLAKQQGLYLVGSNQTPGTNQSLFMRGANSNQVAVLIDGVRITDPSSPNNVVDLSEFSLINVERIEIIEGGHSTIYGGAAIGGAINIITRKNQNQGLHGYAGIQVGTYGKGSSTISEHAEVNYRWNSGVYVNGSIFNQNVAGLNASIDTLKIATPDKDGFRKTDGYLKAGYRKNNWDVFVSYKNVNQRAEIDNAAFTDDDNNYVKFTRNLWNYGLAYQLNPKWKLSVLGSLSNSRRLNENDSSKTSATQFDGNYLKSAYDGYVSTHEVQANYANEGFKAVMGAGIYDEKMSFNSYFYSSSFGGFESTTNYDTIQTRASTEYAFGQVQLHGKRAGISVGGRFSHHSLFGNYATFEINPSINISSSSLLFASVSSGFNAPSLYQLFDPTQDFGSFTTRGNRDLKAEKSLSVELGYKKEFTGGSYLTTSLFNTQVKNDIEYVYLWNKNTAIDELSFGDYLGDTYINVAQQNTMGFEMAGNLVMNSKISVNVNFTWLTGKLKFSPGDIDAVKTGGNHVQVYSNGAFVNQAIEKNILVRRPRATAFGELIYRIVPMLSVSANYRLAGSRSDSAYDPTLGPFGALNQSNVKGYQLIDVGVNWRATPWVSVALKLENIFDQQYQEIFGYNSRGRSGYVKLNFRW